MTILDLAVYFIGALLLVIFYQQWFFLKQINKLVDKAMSTSYAEYARVKAQPVKPEPKIEELPQEDLTVLNEYAKNFA